MLPLGTAGLVMAGVTIAPSALASTTTTFTSTGGEQTYSVPAGATAVTITAVGAPGGSSWNGVHGGKGAKVTATVPLPAGTTTLYVEVGGAGATGPCLLGFDGGGGFNGGGSTVCGGGGGGASDVRTTSMASVPDAGLTAANDSRIVVAGGGGGGGDECAAPGGTAGDSSAAGAGAGGAGTDSCDSGNPGFDGAFAGTSGGAGGAGTVQYACAGGDGSLGQGGDTSDTCDSSNYGGAGGGGYYGGGAGGDGFSGGGGGGAGTSSWAPAATNTSMSEDTTGTPGVEITPVVPAPDLSVTDHGPASVASGTFFTYTLVATNTGGSSADAVVVTDTLPATAKYVSVSTTQGSCTRAAPPSGPKPKGGTVTCAIGSLGAGSSVSVAITMLATSPGTIADSAAASATNTSAQPDVTVGVTTVVQGS
jgi:uncharacterized repeat protein (TIGR01451 family)